MYAAADTSNPLGRRPWSERLSLGEYRQGSFVLPTATAGYSAVGMPFHATGLGDMSTTSKLALYAGAAALAYWLFFRAKKRAR